MRSLAAHRKQSETIRNHEYLIFIFMSKKKQSPRFYISRLRKKWPFSLKLAKDLFRLNRHSVCSSLRDFFVYTAIDLEEDKNDSLEEKTYLSYSEKNEIIGKMDILNISKYPGFFIKNNKVHYKETLKSKVQNSRKEELIIKIYTLDHISYQTIILEGTKFYINNFLQGSVVNFSAVELSLLSLSLIWSPVFEYLLFTTFSSSMKKMLENQNYRKNYEEQILITFEDQFKKIKYNPIHLNKILSKTERSVFEERLLNVLLFSGIPENKGKILITNFFSTESLDEILSFYQELLSQF